MRGTWAWLIHLQARQSASVMSTFFSSVVEPSAPTSVAGTPSNPICIAATWLLGSFLTSTGFMHTFRFIPKGKSQQGCSAGSKKSRITWDGVMKSSRSMDRMVADAIGRARFSKSRSWNPLLQNSRAKIMNPQQAQDQVKHMREFIIHEANEKADELNAKAEQDYTVEKQRLVEDAKLQIKKEFERRMNNVELGEG